jgi:catechol-2,3-dioxygenase
MASNGIKSTAPVDIDKMVNGKPLAPGKIAHWGMRTTPENFEKMVEWHCNFFGGEVVYKLPTVAFVRFDDEHHRLVIVADAGHKHVENRRAACGIYHIAFTLDTLADLAVSYEQKKARGILPHWPVNHGMSTSMYYFDPDKNEFEIQVDNFATAEEAHAFMRTEEYTINPIGVDMDPEEFVRRVKSGEPEAEIKKRPVIGQRHTRWENSLYFKESDKWND